MEGRTLERIKDSGSWVELGQTVEEKIGRYGSNCADWGNSRSMINLEPGMLDRGRCGGGDGRFGEKMMRRCLERGKHGGGALDREEGWRRRQLSIEHWIA